MVYQLDFCLLRRSFVSGCFLVIFGGRGESSFGFLVFIGIGIKWARQIIVPECSGLHLSQLLEEQEERPGVTE